MQVLLAGAKGKKDRYVSLPKSVLDHLRVYYLEYKPKDFLFEGQDGGRYAIRSVQAVFRNAMKKAGINRPVGIHGLRHSYATHLHEYGTDITLIQKLLGHNNLKTTLLYTHVSRKSLAAVASPLDRMPAADPPPKPA
jgi:site-specific recombinase XerD